MSLTGLGRGDVLTPVNAGTVRETTTRVEIVRPGVIEWYENSPLGLEQGFTIVTRTPGEGPFVLELLVERARARLRGSFVNDALLFSD